MSILLSVSSALAASPPSPAQALEHLAVSIETTYPQVSHLTADQLMTMLEWADGRVIVLDVRTADEFAVSHIAGAIRIEPTRDAVAQVSAMAEIVRGKIVVAYCSVGIRSASLLARIGGVLDQHGATKVYNLRGGLFHWHNQLLPATSANGPTRRIHPYSSRWRSFLVP